MKAFFEEYGMVVVTLVVVVALVAIAVFLSDKGTANGITATMTDWISALSTKVKTALEAVTNPTT